MNLSRARQGLKLLPWVPLVEFGIRRGNIDALTRIMGVELLRESSGDVTAGGHEAIRTAAALTRRLPFPDTCLRRAIYAARLARGEVVIGVRREGDRVMAHAWLRVDGRSFDPGGGSGDFRAMHR